jgi:type II secretory pathway predicted ATPase ExeA/cytoskeletal protein CcmA (bactofilin family)
MVNKNQSLIGESMSIVGDVTCKGEVILEGRLEGSFAGKNLIIRKTGKLLGEGKGESIECSGYMEGRILTMSLRLLKTGRHVGTVETRDLVVEPGAVLDCALQSGSLRWRENGHEEEKERIEPPADIGDLLSAFSEECRPCCMDVPWSERLELYSHLLELLERGKPLVKISGTSGSGKSALVGKLHDSLPENFSIVQIEDQVGSVTDLMREVAAKLLAEDAAENQSQHDLAAELKTEICRRVSKGERIVVIIDNAQEMYPATLEGVTRMLTDGYGEGEEMAQVILLGTALMESKLVPTITEYFEDETNCQLTLEPLNIKDTADYLRFSLQLASGGDGVAYMSIFPYETIQSIHQQSEGNIATINRLAAAALEKAHSAGVSVVAPHML